MLDTSDEMFRMQARIFSRMSPQQRFQLGLQMIEDGCLILDNRLREQMPASTGTARRIRRFEELYREELPPLELSACLEGLKKYWQGRLDETEADSHFEVVQGFRSSMIRMPTGSIFMPVILALAKITTPV